MIEFSAPPTLWLVTYLVHSTVAFALVWALERCGLLRTTRTREAAWRVALLGPLLSSTLRSLGLGFALPGSEQPALALARLVVAVAPAGPATSPEQPAPASALARVGHGLDLVSLVWILGAGFASLRLAWLAWRARLLLRAAVPAPADWIALWRALCARHGLRATPLALNAGLSGPVTLPRGGVRLAPWCVREFDAPEREALLLHELGHRLRRDPLWRLGLLLLQALLWLQPLVRLARRRLETLAEFAADDQARASGAEGRALAGSLLACATRPRQNFALASSFEGHGTLSERVERLLAPVEPRPAPAALLRACAALGLLGLCVAMPGCDPSSLRSGERTSVSLDDHGAVEVTIERANLRLALTCDVPFVTVDTPELVALERDGRFTLRELRAGHTQHYQVTRHQGRLELEFERDGDPSPFDETARTWVRETLATIGRDTSFSPATGRPASEH